MGNVRYLSSAGIRVLIIAHKKGKKNNKQITLGEISVKVKDVLDTVGILPLFNRSGRV
jgi:anti-anti-sigma factor